MINYNPEFVRIVYKNKTLFSFKKICKIFQIPRHIKSLEVCMEY